MAARIALVIAAVAAAIGLAGLAISQNRTTAQPAASMTPAQLLNRPIPQGQANSAQLQLGRYLVAMGDCASCHTRDGGEPMAGGLGMNTPFGVIYTPNLTSDADTGIGGWTPAQFYRAMHLGRDDQNRNLYPAFPYAFFTRIGRTDTDAILAYLKTVPAVRYTPPPNRLPFPLNIRFMVKGWNLLFFRPGFYQQDHGKSAEWNRGAYIVNGLGHCGQCHTPVNLLGANEQANALRGGSLENWVAPDLTANTRVGIGGWSNSDIVEYLRTGRNARAQAAGPMAEVVSYSTSLLSDGDLAAIATYLKDQPPSPSPRLGAPDAGAMRRGAAVYSDACASCHLERGVGQPRYFPPLAGDAVLQQANSAGLAHMILAGVRTAPTASRPSPLAMPSFAWKLSDQEIADVATYIRNSWGNRAAPVSAGEVARVRRKTGLGDSHLTQNSGDHE
jgi:mono/diheme cytochrome c family protein